MKQASRSAGVGVERACTEVFRSAQMTVPIAKLSFWGVRGSTPTVDPATWRYGGNTPRVYIIGAGGMPSPFGYRTGSSAVGRRPVRTERRATLEAQNFALAPA